MGGRHRLLDIDKPVKTADGEGLTLPDVLADTDPNPFGELFWRTLRPLLPERHFIVLFMRWRRFPLAAIGAHLGVSYQRVQQIGSAALKDVQRIVATNPAARRALLAPIFMRPRSLRGTASSSSHLLALGSNDGWPVFTSRPSAGRAAAIRCLSTIAANCRPSGICRQWTRCTMSWRALAGRGDMHSRAGGC